MVKGNRESPGEVPISRKANPYYRNRIMKKVKPEDKKKHVVCMSLTAPVYAALRKRAEQLDISLSETAFKVLQENL